MASIKRILRAAARWAAANPAKAAELAIVLVVLGSGLATTGRIERRIVKRLVRLLF